jgi:hypothetical protein
VAQLVQARGSSIGDCAFANASTSHFGCRCSPHSKAQAKVAGEWACLRMTAPDSVWMRRGPDAYGLSGGSVCRRSKRWWLAVADQAVPLYRDGQSRLDEVLAQLTANRDALLEEVRDHLPGVRVTAPEGTYLAWLDRRQSPAADNPYQFFLTRGQGCAERRLDVWTPW